MGGLWLKLSKEIIFNYLRKEYEIRGKKDFYFKSHRVAKKLGVSGAALGRSLLVLSGKGYPISKTEVCGLWRTEFDEPVRKPSLMARIRKRLGYE